MGSGKSISDEKKPRRVLRSGQFPPDHPNDTCMRNGGGVTGTPTPHLIPIINIDQDVIRSARTGATVVPRDAGAEIHVHLNGARLGSVAAAYRDEVRRSGAAAGTIQRVDPSLKRAWFSVP